MSEDVILTTSQKDFFLKEGYLKLHFTIPPKLLKKLHSFFEIEMNVNSDNIEKVVNVTNNKSFVTSLENICSKGDFSCLELLGFAPILETAAFLCGEDFFMIQEFAVMKSLGDNLPVLWHQDMHHQRNGTCFTMGIYLDDAHEGDGALQIVPKSHLSQKGICDLQKEPSIPVPMKAGQILIHDMMLAHSSEPLQKNSLRRVIYFEFLSTSHVLKEGIYSEQLIVRRTKLLFAATKFYALQNPTDRQFLHKRKQDEEDELKTVEELLLEIYALPINARPSTYCFENI